LRARFYGAILGSDSPPLIDDLLLQICLVGKRLFQGIFVGAWVNREQKITLLDKGIVFHRQLDQATANLGDNFDKVCPYIGIVGARIPVGFPDDQEQHHEGGRHGCNADGPAQPFAGWAFS
jgi:hypothetical protein